jgi:hypothetical protein
MGRPKKRDGAIFPPRGVDNVRAGRLRQPKRPLRLPFRPSSGVLLMEVHTTGSLLEPNSSAPSALHRGSCELSEQGLIFGV